MSFFCRAQDNILKDLHTDLTKEFEFVVAENHFEVIPGKTEGVYAWIAINYALDRFSHSAGKSERSHMFFCTFHLSQSGFCCVCVFVLCVCDLSVTSIFLYATFMHYLCFPYTTCYSFPDKNKIKTESFNFMCTQSEHIFCK